MHTSRKTLVNSIRSLIERFPVVTLLGARQTGKTTIAKLVLPKAHYFDLERESDFKRINESAELLFKETKGPYFFDEAQLSPQLFKAIRVEVDKNRNQTGQFLISGSSSPELLKEITESLAGRVAIVEIGTLDWNETKDHSASLIYSHLEENAETFTSLKPLHTHEEILNTCLYGTYPEPFFKKNDTLFFDQWMESYVQSYIDRDIRKLFPNLNLDAYKRFIRMLAFSSGDIINQTSFSNSLDVSGPTVKNYLDIAQGTFLWRQLLPYEVSSKKRYIKMPKGHLRDSGITNYLLNIPTTTHLKSHPQFGKIFESFVIEQVIKGFKNSLIKANFYHYRTSNHSEIDLIVELKNGIVPIEIKSGSVTSASQLRAMEQFIQDEKLPYGIVINNGDSIFKITEKIIQIPTIFW